MPRVTQGTLWTTVVPQFEQRLDSTIHALLLLLRRHAVPDVYVGFQNINNDGFGGGAPGPPVFSFSRSHGAEYPLLFPDADFWGWPHDWIAPHDLLTAQLAAEQPVWADRQPGAYWSGTLLTENRGEYANCAAAHPGLVHVSAQSFDAVRQGTELVISPAGNALKPASKDLRSLLKHKFNAYLYGHGWSTSLKRIAASGAAVIMPVPNPFDDLTSLALEHCNCTFGYDPERLCDSLLRVLNGTSDALAAQYAAASRAVAAEQLSADKLLTYVHSMLHGIAKTQARTHP